MYYLQSRYYNPAWGRFISADAYISTGQGILGNNMFAYCNNNPVNCADSSGQFPEDVSGYLGAEIGRLVYEYIYSVQQSKRQAAVKKYNANTVNVYFKGNGLPDSSKVNARFYSTQSAANAVNIGVDKSREITSRYEMDAVLDVIMSSEFYSADQFGSKDFMRAQWLAHNWSYDIASSGDIGFSLMRIASGSDNPLESGSSLDIRSLNNMLRRQKYIYHVISWFY